MSSVVWVLSMHFDGFPLVNVQSMIFFTLYHACHVFQ